MKLYHGSNMEVIKPVIQGARSQVDFGAGLSMDDIFHHILYIYLRDVTAKICTKYGFDEDTAMRKFLFSQTYQMLADIELEMWDFTPDVIFQIWECEQINGDPRTSEYIGGAA